MATQQHTTKPLSSLFRDPYVAAAFKAAEDDGLSPAPVSVDPPHSPASGAAEPVQTIRPLETA
ncbi:hypothetical protein ACVIM9_002706 [Bradyrhizobium sp. USDA 4520]